MTRSRCCFHAFLFVFLVTLIFSYTSAFADPLYDAWGAYAQPAIHPEKFTTSAHVHRAREEAINALVAVEDKKPVVRESLGYFYLRDFQYRNAKESFDAAIKRNGGEPRLRYLLAQVKATLLLAEPAKVREQCKEPIDEFRRAAERDKENALPLLQAASVAFDCKRPDLALPLVAEALRRPVFRFYKLPMPEDVTSDPAQATKAWWGVQSELWNEATSRTVNTARWLGQLAGRRVLSGNYDEANLLYQQAVDIGRLLAGATPPLGLSLSAGLEIQRQAWSARAAAYEKLRPEDAQTARTEQAKIETAQRSLEAKWADLHNQESAQPPTSVHALLANQSKLVENVAVP